jgi:hypothetical protein
MSSLKKPNDMSADELAMALRNAGVLEAWITAVKSHAFDVLKAGGTIPGFKLGYGAKRRVWKFGTIESAIEAMKALGLTKDDIFTQPEILTLPKMEKVLKEKHLWPSKKRGGPRPVTPLDQFTDYSIPEPRVMPIDPHDEENERVSEAEKDFA